MSGRYYNKAITKDIFSNSGAISTYNFVDTSNLQLLNIQPETGTVQLASSYANNVPGILLPIPVVSWDNLVVPFEDALSDAFSDFTDGDGAVVLWAGSDTNVNGASGANVGDYSLNKVVYVGSFNNPEPSGSQVPSSGFYIWHDQQYGRYKLMFNGVRFTNGNVVILSVAKFSNNIQIPEGLETGIFITNQWGNLRYDDSDRYNMLPSAPSGIPFGPNPGNAFAPYFYNSGDSQYYYFDTNSDVHFFANNTVYIDVNGFQYIGEAHYPLFGGVNISATVNAGSTSGVEPVQFNTGSTAGNTGTINLDLSANTTNQRTAFFSGFAATIGDGFDLLNPPQDSGARQLANGTVISNTFILHNWAVAVGSSFDNTLSPEPYPARVGVRQTHPKKANLKQAAPRSKAIPSSLSLQTPIPLMYINITAEPLVPPEIYIPPHGGLIKYCPLNDIYTLL